MRYGLLAAVLVSAGVAVLVPRSEPLGLGTGRDGALVVREAGTAINRSVRVKGVLAPGERVVRVSATQGFAPGDLVLLMQVPARGEAAWELVRIEQVGVGAFLLAEPLVHGYTSQGTQAVRVPEYTRVTVRPEASLVAEPWDGKTGGVVAFLAQETVHVEGEVVSGGQYASAEGFGLNRSGSGGCLARDSGWGAGAVFIRAGHLSGSGLIVAEGSPRTLVGAAGSGVRSAGRVALCVAEPELERAVLPLPVIESPASGEVVRTSRPIVRGRLGLWGQYSQVHVYVDGIKGPPVAVRDRLEWAHVVPGDLAEGPHTLVAVAEDEEGNRQRSEAVRLTVDAKLPSASIERGPHGPVSSTQAEFHLSADEEGVSLECSVDGEAWRGCSSPLLLGELTQGPHTLAVRATQGQGSPGPVATHSWVVDTVAPEVRIEQEGAEGQEGGSDVGAFTLASSEQQVSYRCRLDGGRPQACTSAVYYEGLEEGTHVLEVYAEDVAGNRSGVERRHWKVAYR